MLKFIATVRERLCLLLSVYVFFDDDEKCHIICGRGRSPSFY